MPFDPCDPGDDECPEREADGSDRGALDGMVEELKGLTLDEIYERRY